MPMNLDTFRSALAAHDRWYGYSDDSRVHRRGRDAWDRIRAAQTKLEAEHGRDVIREIYWDAWGTDILFLVDADKASPEALERYMARFQPVNWEYRGVARTVAAGLAILEPRMSMRDDNGTDPLLNPADKRALITRKVVEAPTDTWTHYKNPTPIVYDNVTRAVESYFDGSNAGFKQVVLLTTDPHKTLELPEGIEFRREIIR